ncbi:MAG: hypothetical protein ACK417_06475 [Bacteroidia bacterium]
MRVALFACIFGSILMISLSRQLLAQQSGSLRQISLSLSDSLQQLDSMMIAPGSIRFKNQSGYWQLWPDSLFVPPNSIRSGDFAGKQFLFEYRVLQYDFSRPRWQKDPRLSTDIRFARENPFNVMPVEQSADNLFDFRQLDKQGSISRGLGLGNNQDLVLNSGFNLQLSGQLTDSVEILASMTDNNLPFQPDGFTQQLQDFDRVFVQLRSRRHSLIVGDYDLNRPDAYFLNFFKNVKGGRVDTKSERLGKGMLKQTLSASAARGQFGRKVFMGREGNQGPYRLTGNNPAEFIVILAGSERIYIDGELLKRGEQYDYVIDYNTADLSFTPNRIITNQSRIIAEFEYANQAFVRSIVYYNATYEQEKWDVRFHTYREGDSRNQPLFQDLNDDQKRFLSGLGDSVNNAFFPAAVQAPFDGRQVRYKQVDSLGFFPVYVYSINPDSANFAVSFSLVGQGRGDYVPAVSTANGRVFEWLAPDVVNGDTIRKGTHAPVVRLQAPNKLQMSTASFRYRPDTYSRLEVEAAQSVNDRNLYSDLDNDNNRGYALKARYETERPVLENKQLYLIAGADFERLDANFRVVQPYRNMEFARDWNLPAIYAEDDEQISSLRLGLRFRDSARIVYQFTNYSIAENYTGNRQRLMGNWQNKHTKAAIAYDVLSTSSDFFEGDYTRVKADLSRKFGAFEAGAGYELEDNLVFVPSTDTLAINSFRFDIVNLFVSYQTPLFDKISLRYTYRDDLLPFGQVTALQGLQTGHNYTLATEINRWEDHLLKLTATYRLLDLYDTPEQDARREQNYLGQLEYNGSFLKKAISSSSFYSFAQGQELRREIAFLEVPRGQGNYIWVDYNGNGVQEIDEFELAFFSDQANYIKVFIPGNQFVPTFSNRFNQTLQLNPGRLLRPKHFLGRLSNLTAFSVERRNQGDNPVSYLNPFNLQLADTSLVSATGNIRNTLFFDRNNPKFGLDMGYQRNLQRNLLANGTETRESIDRNIRLRWNLLKRLNYEQLLQSGQRVLSADLFVVRNYHIRQYEWEPSLNWTATEKLRAGIKYAFRDKRNQRAADVFPGPPETVIIHELGAELNYNLLASSSVRITLSNVNNRFEGDVNSPAGFEMLQGLLPGSNQLWSVSLFRKLSSNLQLNLTYDGRAAANASTVHSGRVQARLVF